MPMFVWAGRAPGGGPARQRWVGGRKAAYLPFSGELVA